VTVTLPRLPKLPTGSPGLIPLPVPGMSGGGVPVPSFMPPNGFAGLAQQTPAVQSLYRTNGRSSTRRRKRATSAAAPKRRRKSTSRKKGAHLVKGSAAAKRHMAKLRRMVGKRR
jgi:hypothetical protein